MEKRTYDMFSAETRLLYQAEGEQTGEKAMPAAVGLCLCESYRFYAAQGHWNFPHILFPEKRFR